MDAVRGSQPEVSPGSLTGSPFLTLTPEAIQAEIKSWVINKGLGETPLHRAARLGYYVRGTSGCTAWRRSCRRWGMRDNAGYTPLHEACTKGQLGMARLLLRYGAQVNASLRQGNIRPIHGAIENGHMEVVRLLLSYGADPLLGTYSGLTPVALARESRVMQSLLQDHLADVQGKPAPPWQFPSTLGSDSETGFDVFDAVDLPPDSPDQDDLSSMFFETSEVPMINTYQILEDACPDPFVLLSDLSSRLGPPVTYCWSLRLDRTLERQPDPRRLGTVLGHTLSC
ncbi:unnamed protein product [Darwinula stevensoni]|uniref:Uncharacterized protein n=1 Tax=Darwinula stevensoni TaxID=69355 RepID=A0A7R9ACS8_9CRUS|nr:unnamed protein product [Darwinula stevensoni]CAG0900647.1 unnamed protein product [Darwinula stevensoni]